MTPKKSKNTPLTRVSENETESVSSNEQTVTDASPKNFSPGDFAENASPENKEISDAPAQTDENAAANTFETDSVILNRTEQPVSVQTEQTVTNQTGRIFVPETFLKNNQPTASPVAPVESSVVKPIVFSDKIIPENKPETKLSATILTTGEIADNAKNAVIFGENVPNRPLAKRIESGEIKLQEKPAQTAVLVAQPTAVLTDAATARAINNSQVSDASSSVNAVVRRENGAVMGGALINNSFAAFDNLKNSENKSVVNSRSIGKTDFGGANGFAAGATGALMSAAIGSLIPNSDAAVSGVVGFISSVVVGVEPDQGLRWLGGERPAIAPPHQSLNLPVENSFASNLQLTTA